jgi:hypothetical protein
MNTKHKLYLNSLVILNFKLKKLSSNCYLFLHYSNCIITYVSKDV